MAAVPFDDLPDQVTPRQRFVPQDDLPQIADIEMPRLDVEPQQPTQRKPFKERATEIGTAGGLSAALGAVAPELFTLAGGAAAAFPVTAPAAPFLLTTGQALRGQRLRQAGYGLLGGLMGETGGQVVEARGGTPMQAEVARFLAGTFGPEIPRQLGKVGGTVVARGLQAMGLPGASRTATIGQMLEREAAQPGSMTAEQRAFIQQKVNEIRGGKSSLQAQKEVADMLARTAQQRVSQAEQQALNLEQQADELLTAAQTRAGQIDANTQQRIGALQSQFENAAIGLRQDADTRARQAIEAGRQRANQIMQQVQGQSPQLQSVARIDADQAIAQAQQQADQIAAQAQQRIQRLRGVRERLRTTGQQRVQQAQVQVGEPKKISDIGTDIREGFTSVLDGLRKTRADNAKTYSQEAFGEAFQKEAAGASFSQTKSAQNAVQELNTMLKNPVTGTVGVPEGTIRNQIQGIRDVLQGFRRAQGDGGQVIDVALRPSFEQLEIIRRSLRDRASGLPAEGYDAIGQQMAGRLSDLVENTQKEFAPKFASFLERYKADSQPINRFVNNLAKRVTGREEADFAQFKVDPAGLADNVFASKQGVAQLVETVGPEQAENIARSYVANTLQNADGPAIQRFLTDRKTQDWLDTFPRLQQELIAGAQRLGTAERVSGRRGKLAEALGTEMRAIPRTTETATRRVEEKGKLAAERLEREGETRVRELTSAGERQSQQAITAGEQQFRDITGGAEQQLGASAKAVERQQRALREQAERAGKTEVSTAEQAAKGLTKEAEALRKSAQETADLLTRGDQSGAARVRDLVMSEKTNELTETAKVILANPAGKELFADAVSQVVADLASSSPKTAADKWKYIGDRLIDAGLIDQRFNQQLADQLQEILVTPVDARQKLTLVKSLLKNAIVSYGGPAIGREVMSLMEDENATQ
jgi:hypothetical protein